MALRNGCIKFSILLFLLFAIPFDNSAQPARFRHYSTDEGFTGAAFKTIVQDSLGFLWISSGSGLYKFDGYNFIRYKPDPKDSLSLPNEMVKRIWMDPFGKLWTAFPDRISYYDRDIDGFRSCKVQLDGEIPESLWFENSNVVWIGTLKKGLMRLDLNTKEVITYHNKHGDDFKNNRCNTIKVIKDGGRFLLLGTANGLWKFDKTTKTFTRPYCDPSDSTLLYSGVVSKVFPHHGYHWLWIDQHLIKVNDDYSVVQTFDFTILHKRFDVEQSYENARLVEIAEDAEGTFWIASQGLGLTRFNPLNNQLTNFRNEKDNENSLPSDVLYHVMIDRYGNVWAATVTKGIVQLRKQSLDFYNHLPGKSTSDILVLTSKSKNHILVGTQGNGLYTSLINSRNLDSLSFTKYEPLTKIQGFENIVAVTKSKKQLWIGSLASGAVSISLNSRTGWLNDDPIKIFQPSSSGLHSTSNNFISEILEEENGDVWVGTFIDGLNKIVITDPGKKDSIVRYTHDPLDSTSINHNSTVDLLPEGDHTFLVTTFGGLDRYHSGRFEHLLKNIACTQIIKTVDNTLIMGSKNGAYEGVKVDNRYSFTKIALPVDPFITSIQEDRSGRLWLLSYEGLIFYDRKERISLVFKKEDGLPSSRTISAGGSAQMPDGTMIFSNAEGLTLFDPLSLRINTSKPKPIITHLKINNRIIHTGNRKEETRDFTIPQSINTLQHLTLDHTQNILTLEFSAMDFTAPERNLYEYQLKDFDENWVQADWKNRTATYTNLQPGHYTFKVRASNRDGIWNENETALAIHVLPPPWKTWWAFSLYGIAFAGILFAARRNIIQRERLAAKLKLEHLELEKVQVIDKVKTDFFANISHEFRTPLTLIQGPIQDLLMRFKKDKDVVSQLNLVDQNANRLLRLVNQILELARLESGGLKKEISEGNLFSFLREVVKSFSSLAVQKRISLVQQFPDHHITANFDKDKLEKILTNLLGNAIKFTPEKGAIIINASLVVNEMQNGNQNLVLRVTDTGKGVPRDQIDKIFERFYQVSEDGSQNAGTGIGLALCKELGEFLGGTLTVESTVGEGSKFTLTMPVYVTGQAAHEPTTAEELDDESRSLVFYSGELSETISVEEEKPIILVVEDHADLRKFIIFCLGNDYHFLEASNGKEGLRKAVDQVPALVLSDVMMPDMDGIEMCYQIKHDHRTNHIPVIFLTAKANDESKLSGLGIGADDYLIKPFNKEELILKIRNQITARARMQEKIRLDLLSASTTLNAISADEVFLDRVKKIIEGRMSDYQLSVELLAEEIGLSRVQLYRKVVALTGISVNEFIRKLRLHKAAQLLEQNWGPVSQVAYETGFTNPSYFTKCFKEQFGVLPTEYSTAKKSFQR